MPDLVLPDDAAAADLRTFCVRARRLDAAAAVRLVARGGVLAAYAGVLHGAGGPTVLGLRTQTVPRSVELDVTVPAAALLDRLAAVPPGEADGRVVPVPDLTAADAAWAGVLPPRSGWTFEGLVPVELLRGAAAAGIAEVAAGTPAAAGGSAVARLRAVVWGRPIPGTGGLPAGVALAADAFGFVARTGEADAVTAHRAGAWWRLSAPRGHVLARSALL